MVPQLLKQPFLRDVVLHIDEGRRQGIIRKIEKYLTKGDRILDIGCGLGSISQALMDAGHQVTSIDIQNGSLYPEVKPIVYDGIHIPFKSNSFDVALLITVLHHTPDPQAIIAEARRVAKKIIIIEDTIEGEFQKYATFVMDSVLNLEFMGHPHTNKSDAGWHKVFKDLKLKKTSSVRHTYWKLFTSTTYVLKT